MKLEFEKSRNHPSFSGPHRCDRLDFKVIPAEDGSSEPWLQVNGVKYAHHLDFADLHNRIKANDARSIGKNSYCTCCKLTPCISVTAGTAAVLSFAKALRDRGERFHVVKDNSLRMLKATKAMKDYMKESEGATEPECLDAWVEARCCVALNW